MMSIKKDIPLEYNLEIKSEGKTRFYLPSQPKKEAKIDRFYFSLKLK